MTPRRRAEGALLLTTLVWGTTFVGVQTALEAWPPFLLMGVRFSLAALVFLPSILRRGALSWKTVRRGALLGVLIYLGFGLQTLGLERTSPARSSFFTALSVLLVPIFAYAFLRRTPLPGTRLAILFGAAGIFALLGADLGDDGGARRRLEGDLLTVGCAVAFAVQILVLERFAADSPVVPLTGVELATTAILGLASAPLDGRPAPSFAGANWGLVLYLGWIATAATLWGQVYGQRSTTATRAAFLFALEPVFAVLFAWALRGDGLAAREWIGGGLIVAAAVVADRPIPRLLGGRRAEPVAAD